MPAASRLTVRPKRNRKRPVSLWSRRPSRAQLIDACGRALRRSVPALVATAVILVLGAGLFLGYRFLTTSERFAIAAIEVHGASHLTTAEVRTALPAKVGENIFTADLGDLAHALRKNPWIRSASAHRVLPDTLVVEIGERTAVAVVQIGNTLYLADETGHPFKQLDAPNSPKGTNDAGELPILTGAIDSEIVLRALDVLERWRSSAQRPDVGEIHIDAHHALTLRTHDGVAIQLGAMRELEARLPTFDAAWAELTDSERARTKALHLDGRSDQVTVAFAKD